MNDVFNTNSPIQSGDHVSDLPIHCHERNFVVTAEKMLIPIFWDDYCIILTTGV